MEEILILIIQFLVEGVGQALLELPFDFATSKSEAKFTSGFLAIIVGGVIGGLTLLIFPHSLVKHAWLRCLNLIASPLLSYAISKRLAMNRLDVSPVAHARLAFLFTFGLAAIRFAYASY